MGTRARGITGVFSGIPKGLRLQLQKGVNLNQAKAEQKAGKPLRDFQRPKVREAAPEPRTREPAVFIKPEVL